MRRKDREITDSSRIEAFLEQQQILRVGFCDNGEVYIVPVNYGYRCQDGKYCFYFHGAKAGRKYGLARTSPKVGFEIDGNYRLLAADSACDFSAEYQSIIGTGTLCIVQDREEKIIGLNSMMRQTSHIPEWQYEEARLNAVAVFRLDVEQLSCKARQ